jgi:hypothetical protein
MRLCLYCQKVQLPSILVLEPKEHSTASGCQPSDTDANMDLSPRPSIADAMRCDVLHTHVV